MTLKRMTFLQHLLAFMGLKGRLHLEWISSAEAQKFVATVTGFTETIRRLGPSPLRSAASRRADNVLARPLRRSGCLDLPRTDAAPEAGIQIANG
jgi:F420-non-reducing hydrogenase iron-sulfur subunit